MRKLHFRTSERFPSTNAFQPGSYFVVEEQNGRCFGLRPEGHALWGIAEDFGRAARIICVAACNNGLAYQHGLFRIEFRAREVCNVDCSFVLFPLRIKFGPRKSTGKLQ